MPDLHFFDFLIFGNISTEFIIDLHNQPHQNICGGSALYAAGGLCCWKNRIAISSHAHAKNQLILERVQKKYQIDFRGVHFRPEVKDDRQFLGYVSPYEIITENPVAFYASKNLPFPKDLIGFNRSDTHEDQKFFPEDILPNYWDISTALLCNSCLNFQLQVSSMIQKASTKTLLIQSSEQYMKMSNFDILPILLKDVTVFVTTVNQISTLFRHRSQDIWEMAEYLCSLGCEHLVIEDGRFGHFLYDRQTKKRYHMPFYPVDLVDPTGIHESFCGGFIAGLKNRFDPLEALLQGSVSASFTGEGIGPFYGVDAIPGLLQSRLDFSRKLLTTL